MNDTTVIINTLRETTHEDPVTLSQIDFAERYLNTIQFLVNSRPDHTQGYRQTLHNAKVVLATLKGEL